MIGKPVNTIYVRYVNIGFYFLVSREGKQEIGTTINASFHFSGNKNRHPIKDAHSYKIYITLASSPRTKEKKCSRRI